MCATSDAGDGDASGVVRSARLRPEGVRECSASQRGPPPAGMRPVSAPDLSGRVVLITGATDGLGRALAADAARAGATVLVHGRNAERLAETAAEVREIAGEDRVRTYQADFASLAEVRR